MQSLSSFFLPDFGHTTPKLFHIHIYPTRCIMSDKSPSPTRSATFTGHSSFPQTDDGSVTSRPGDLDTSQSLSRQLSATALSQKRSREAPRSETQTPQPSLFLSSTSQRPMRFPVRRLSTMTSATPTVQHGPASSTPLTQKASQSTNATSGDPASRVPELCLTTPEGKYVFDTELKAEIRGDEEGYEMSRFKKTRRWSQADDMDTEGERISSNIARGNRLLVLR
jgi:hypothetical protein